MKKDIYDIIDTSFNKTVNDYKNEIKEKNKIIAFLIKELLHYDICSGINCSNKDKNKVIMKCYNCILIAAKNSVNNKDKEK